jgi:hypothetical protein
VTAWGRRLLPLAALPLLVGAGAPVALAPGLWRIATVPQAATLDGRRLADLPYDAPPPDEVCLSAADAADPARWFARDSAPGCRWSQRSVAGGRVRLSGTCPAEEAGQPAGSTRIAGRWSANRYDLRFATIAHGSNGRMGLDGATTGVRVGPCPS